MKPDGTRLARETRLTPDEQYTHITMWCMLSAPLLLGCDLGRLDPFTLKPVQARAHVVREETLAVEGRSVAARVVDVVQGENNYGRAAIIISGKAADIRSSVLVVLERGVTVLEGRGGYTEAGLDVLYCVVSRGEVSILKRLVQSIDPRAFVVITEASEVLGEGFRKLR